MKFPVTLKQPLEKLWAMASLQSISEILTTLSMGDNVFFDAKCDTRRTTVILCHFASAMPSIVPHGYVSYYVNNYMPVFSALGRNGKLDNVVKLLPAMAIMFLTKAGSGLLSSTIRPYTPLAVCRELFHYNVSRCAESALSMNETDEIEEISAEYLLYFRTLVSTPLVITGLLFGAWSDKYGRVLPMAIPNIGFVFSVFVFIGSWYYPNKSLTLYLIGAALRGVFNINSTLSIVYSYVAESVSDKSRARTLSIFTGILLFGNGIGFFLSGLLQDLFNIPITLLVAASLNFIAAFLCICIPKGTPKKQSKDKSCCTEFRETFIESVFILCKTRDGNSRIAIIFLCFLSALTSFCFTAENDITVLYVQEEPLDWPRSWYGYFTSADQGLKVLFLFILAPLMFKKLSEIQVMLIAIFFGIVRSVWTAYSTVSWMMWTSLVFGMMGAVGTSVTKSLLSKQVEMNELGRVYALLSIQDTLAKPASTAVFMTIYTGTFERMPGIVFFALASVYGFYFIMTCFVMFCIVKKKVDVREYTINTETIPESGTTGSNPA